MISRMILMKAVAIGGIGGLCGLGLGILAAYVAGPKFVGVATTVSLESVIAGLMIAVLVAVLASYPPAKKAAHLDPCLCFQDA